MRLGIACQRAGRTSISCHYWFIGTVFFHCNLGFDWMRIQIMTDALKKIIKLHILDFHWDVMSHFSIPSMPRKCTLLLSVLKQKQSLLGRTKTKGMWIRKRIFLLTLINSHSPLNQSATLSWSELIFSRGEKGLLFYFKTRKMIPPLGQESSKQLEGMSKWVRS